jgi:hypothetical protein
MTLAQDLVAGMRANLTPEVGGRSPDSPLGYGRDAWCVSSATEDEREVDPDSPLGMAQMAMRACTTPRDTCPDAPGRGFDVRRALSRATGLSELLAYEGMATSEIEQDDRVDSVEVSLTLDRSLAIPSVRLRFVITPVRADLGPFAGVITVPETGQAMLELLS